MSQQLFTEHTLLTYTTGRSEDIPTDVSILPTIDMEQVHSNHFSEISGASNQTLLGTDAIFTRQRGLHLKVKHADCLPVLLYHPLPLIGVVHAGRKSTQKNILRNLLQQLKNEYSITDNLQLWFGPAICNDCYQINRDNNEHYDLIENNTTQVRKIFSAAQAKIIYSNHCTAHENEYFFSYRKEGPGVKMNWSGIALV